MTYDFKITKLKYDYIRTHYYYPQAELTVSGTANFAQGSFPNTWQTYVPLGIGFLNLLAGLLTTIAQFLRVSELLEGHRAAAIAYSKFSRNIKVELSLPIDDRTTSGSEFVNQCRNELDRLIEQSPNIPLSIIRGFGKKFENTDFMKPEILDIATVDVYRDDKKEKAKEKLEQIKQTELIRKRLLAGENDRRASIMKQLLEERKHSEMIMIEKANKKREIRKQNVGVGHIQNSMTKLISKLQEADKKGVVLTPSSSDQDPTDESSSSNEVSPVNIASDSARKKVLKRQDAIDISDSDGTQDDTKINIIITDTSGNDV